MGVHGLPMTRSRTRFPLKKGELGLKVWERRDQGGAKVEILRRLKGDERLRADVRETRRALKAGGAIGVR